MNLDLSDDGTSLRERSMALDSSTWYEHKKSSRQGIPPASVVPREGPCYMPKLIEEHNNDYIIVAIQQNS